MPYELDPATVGVCGVWACAGDFFFWGGGGGGGTDTCRWPLVSFLGRERPKLGRLENKRCHVWKFSHFPYAACKYTSKKERDNGPMVISANAVHSRLRGD